MQQKNQEMEQFVYTVSHDLKAPLVTSMSFMGFLKEDIAGKNFGEVADSLQRLEKAHKRMQELINDLLQVSRIGRMELNYEKVPIKEVLAEVAENASERIQATKATFEYAVDFPDVMADRKRLAQAFENLIGNSSHRC